MTSVITTPSIPAIAKGIEGADLNLTVTSQVEFGNLVGDYRSTYHTAQNGFKGQTAALGKNKREALWMDLENALRIIEVISKPEYAEWLKAELDDLEIPIVADPDAQNIYVMYLRLLMGYFPPKPKGWVVGNPEPKFTWSENVWLYARVLRGAVKRGILSHNLFNTLRDEKGFRKFKEADAKAFANDEEEKAKKKRYKAVTADSEVKANLSSDLLTSANKAGDYVLVYGRVASDKKGIQVFGCLDDSSESVVKRIEKLAEKIGKDVLLKQLEALLEQQEAEPELAAA